MDRGGYWIYYAIYCRTASRGWASPSYSLYNGFRSVLPPGQ